MRYRFEVLGWTLIWGGVIVFGYLGWLLFGTDLVNAGVQEDASVQLEATLDTVDPQSEQVDRDGFLGGEPPSIDIPQVVQYWPEDPVATGESFAFMTIPRLGIEKLVVYEGVDTATLKKGPGHMGSTALPGQPGNTVISGHRTTYGRPFFDFDLLEVGDQIEIESASGVHVYEVRESLVVLPTDVWVTDAKPGGWLTMTTCNPKFSARERLVISAEMVAGPNFNYVQLHRAGAEAA